MTTIFQVLFGLAILSLPMIIAGGLVLVLAASASLVPVFMPLTTLLALGAIGVAWMRYRRTQRTA